MVGAGKLSSGLTGDISSRYLIKCEKLFIIRPIITIIIRG